MTACDMEKKLIALVINEEKLTDGPIQMVQKGFKRAIDNTLENSSEIPLSLMIWMY